MTKITSAVLTVLTTLILAVPLVARGEVRRAISEDRPTIIEIGQPHEISMAALRRETRFISELGDYLGTYGRPDYAEIQEVAPQWPWEAYEVRLYYMDRNIEADFGHVFVSPAAPYLGMRKFTGSIPPDKRHQIEVILQVRQTPPPAPAVAAAPPPPPPAPAVVAQQPSTGGLTEALVARIEAAAARAAQAADNAAEQSEAAVRAADRTVNLVEKMEQGAAPQPRRTR